MAAALECWSGRPSTDEDMVEQVLMKTNHRSDAISPFKSPADAVSDPASTTVSTSGTSPTTKKWHRLSRNFSGAIAALKSSLTLDSSLQSRGDGKLSWSGVVRTLTQFFPSSQISEKLVADIRLHFESLPSSYLQAGFDMKEVLFHIRLIDQTVADDLPAFQIQQISDEIGGEGSVVKLTFAYNSSLSWPTISSAIDGSVLCCKKIQIFEKKGLVIGVITVIIPTGGEKQFKSRIDAALRSAAKKQRIPAVKLPFSLCGCKEEGDGSPFAADESDRRIHLPNPLLDSSLLLSVDEGQNIRSGGDSLGPFLVGNDELEFIEWASPSSFRGSYKGKKVWIKKLKGCERGIACEIGIRKELVQLMSCGQKHLLQFIGICIDARNGICVVTKLMEGGSVQDLIERRKKVPMSEVKRIGLDVAEGLMCMNSHGLAYRDLNTQRILLDREGNACLGDMGIVSTRSISGEVTEYETSGYRWLAPEIIAGDPEMVTETCMSNAYSFGMVLWEMVTGEAAYSSYSPVQAAVGIAACGLRPEIPNDCSPVLRSLMLRCWDSCPSKRPRFSEIVASLMKQNT